MRKTIGLYRKQITGLAIVVGGLVLSAWTLNPASEEFTSNPFQAAYEIEPENLISYEQKKEMALGDLEGRIRPEFDLSESLDERVRFWFDIYSKYDSKNYVIHNRKKPWIIYEVVNTDDLFARRKPTWMNRMAADKRAEVKRKFYIKKTRLPNEEVRIQLGQRDFFADGLEKSSRLLPLMEEVFMAEGLPAELARIPLVESSFNHKAESKVGAKGIWQIMPSIGRKFLVMNEKLDERKSPLKSTRVAAYLLEENKMLLGNWPLAVTAYNHGTGGMRKAKKQTNSSDLGVIIKKYKSASFQFASSNFYSCFLAALHAEKYKDFLFPEVELGRPADLTKLKLKFGKSAYALSKDLKINFEDLIEHNPDLHVKGHPKSLFLPKGFALFIPESHEVPREKIKAYSLDSAIGSAASVK